MVAVVVAVVVVFAKIVKETLTVWGGQTWRAEWVVV